MNTVKNKNDKFGPSMAPPMPADKCSPQSPFSSDSAISKKLGI